MTKEQKIMKLTELRNKMWEPKLEFGSELLLITKNLVRKYHFIRHHDKERNDFIYVVKDGGVGVNAKHNLSKGDYIKDQDEEVIDKLLELFNLE